jgi:peptidoglycan/LPS O-acetylase OafA/YrhL
LCGAIDSTQLYAERLLTYWLSAMGIDHKDVRLPHLESIRGIAALAVAVHHAGIVFAVDPQMYWVQMVLRVIGNGGGGIFIFFILSGYVLTLSLNRSGISAPTIVSFYVRRVFRIWPAMIVSIVIALAVLQAVRLNEVPAAGEAFVQWAASATSFPDALRNIFFVSTKMNGPTWTIWTELCWSAILPGLVFVSNRLDNGGRAILMAALVGLHFSTPLTSFANWGYLFFAGVWMTRIPAPSAPRVFLGIGVATTFLGPRIFEGIDELCHLCNAGGTFLILWTAIHNGETLFAWANHRFPRFLGRISYSFYLIHMPVLVGVAFAAFRVPFLYGIAGNALCVMASVLVAVAAASVMYRFVEAPFVEIGKRLSSGSMFTENRTFRVRKRAEAIRQTN